MNNKQRIAVLTDTDCDLPQKYLEKYPIFQLPLVITGNGVEYRDGVDLTAEDIYARQKTEDFKTSLPHPADVDAALNAIRDAGYDQVIVLLLGSALSSATNLLRLAAKDRTDLDIAVYDTKSASVGVGMLALQAAQYAARGLPFHVVKGLTARLIEDTYPFFSLDTLEYLQRGGRIGRVTALAGSLLQIKPILSFDENGTIYTAAKVRGSRAVPDKLLELVQDIAAKEGPGVRYNLMICDGGAPEAGAKLEAAIQKVLPNAAQVIHGQLDATLAVHLGLHLLGAGIQIVRSEL
ncbi:MAG: DegV family protein [Gemmiger sp.]